MKASAEERDPRIEPADGDRLRQPVEGFEGRRGVRHVVLGFVTATHVGVMSGVEWEAREDWLGRKRPATFDGEGLHHVPIATWQRVAVGMEIVERGDARGGA